MTRPGDRGQDPVVLHIEDLDAVPSEGEVLGARPRRRSRWTTIAAPAVGLLLVGGVLGDRAERQQEVDALVADVDSTVTAVRRADTRATLIQIYMRPSSMPGAPAGVPDAELDAIAREAEVAGADELADLRGRLDEATVLPWHTDVAEAREVLRQFVAGQEDRLRRREDEPVPTVQDLADAARAAVPAGEQTDRLETVLGGVSAVSDP